MKQTLIVIDDFYDDPYEVRRFAMQLPFRKKPGATYPGREAISDDRSWTKERNQLMQFINEDLSGIGSKTPQFPQGKFRLAIAADESSRLDGVHEDIQPWSGVIYLSKPEDCNGQGSISFYEHRDTGLREPTREWWIYVSLKLEFADLNEDNRKKVYWSYMRDMNNWIELERIENRFNRAVLLNAKRFHASIGLFGDCLENGRLTQHFEYYYPD